MDFVWIEGDSELINDSNNIPTTAFTIVESKKGYMLVFNKYRNKWELAGGFIEQGESSEECAIRECKEESCQIISALKFVGLAKYESMNAAIYHAFLEKEIPFIENDEIKKLLWWKRGEEIGVACSDSLNFIELYSHMK